MILAILMVFGGAFASLFSKYVSATFKKDFKWKIFFQKNLPLSIFNFFMGVILVVAILTDNADFVVNAGGENITNIFWIAVGSLGHFIYKLIISVFTLLIKKFADRFTELKPRD